MTLFIQTEDNNIISQITTPALDGGKGKHGKGNGGKGKGGKGGKGKGKDKHCGKDQGKRKWWETKDWR